MGDAELGIGIEVHQAKGTHDPEAKLFSNEIWSGGDRRGEEGTKSSIGKTHQRHCRIFDGSLLAKRAAQGAHGSHFRLQAPAQDVNRVRTSVNNVAQAARIAPPSPRTSKNTFSPKR